MFPVDSSRAIVQVMQVKLLFEREEEKRINSLTF